MGFDSIWGIHKNIDGMKELAKLSDYTDPNKVFLFRLLPLSLYTLYCLTFKNIYNFMINITTVNEVGISMLQMMKMKLIPFNLPKIPKPGSNRVTTKSVLKLHNAPVSFYIYH